MGGMMEKMILRSQKKAVFDLIIKTGLDPSNFEWEKRESTRQHNADVSAITYNDSSYFFVFDFMKEGHYCIYSPGVDSPIEEAFPGNWKGEYEHLTLWLRNLKREVHTVDPWEEIKKYYPTWDISLGEEGGNAPFSFTQVKQITAAVDQLKKEIRNNCKLTSEQNNKISSQLDYLVDKAETFGRVDWKNIFIGTLVGLAFELSMNTEQTTLLWGLVKKCFSGILFLTGK